AVPATPSPVEPQFSITGPASGTKPGVAQNFVVDLTDDGGHPRILTLQVPAGIVVNSVTGATYDGVNNTLTFPASSSSATVSLTSPVDAVANIRVVYDQPDLWNINNLIVYEPCDTYAGYQGFLGVSTGTTPRPYREATGTWDTSMPVKLVDFRASAESNTVRLSWVTVAEENAKGFQVQRSKDAKTWHNLGFVTGKSENGNSTRELSYRFTDATPLKGNNYYRLQMVDLDGTFAYSQMRAIRVDGAASALLTYPNPVVNGNLNVDVANTDSYRAEIHNLTGIKVLHQNLGKGRELNVSSLPTGIYVLRLISADGDVRTGKFLVK
ncbi:T9SS type A sorting domain-containing protein, partial [Ravibacter arvi]|uniref:T9SS type A sorting domain-containing protein n=1 Tax=Ravibacter arvi TaxID=2051041 RepID=UPI0031E99742